MFISTTRNQSSSHIALNRQKSKKWPFMVMNLMKMLQSTQKHQNLVLWKWWSISGWCTNQSINKQTVQLESHLYILCRHICITCTGYTANFTLFCLNHSIRPGNWGRWKHSPNKKCWSNILGKKVSSFLPSNYMSGTYAAGILNFFLQIY